jgi:hypothetical protein
MWPAEGARRKQSSVVLGNKTWRERVEREKRGHTHGVIDRSGITVEVGGGVQTHTV